MIIYIAGKMGGLPNLNKQAFDEKEKYLIEKGHIVLNPAKLPIGLPHESYMKLGLAMLNECDAIYMLKSYVDSRGAKIELNYAMYQHKFVLFEGISDEQL